MTPTAKRRGVSMGVPSTRNSYATSPGPRLSPQMKGHAMPGTCTALAINRMSTRIDDVDAKVEDEVDKAGGALHRK
jgi:hypothetical protein